MNTQLENIGSEIEQHNKLTNELSGRALKNQIVVNALCIGSELHTQLSGRTMKSVEPGNGDEAGWIVINFVPQEGENYRSFLTLWLGGERRGLDPLHDWDMALHHTNREGGGPITAIYRSLAPEGPDLSLQDCCKEASEFVSNWKARSSSEINAKESYVPICQKVLSEASPDNL
jgi:hypothetical protein